MKDKKVIIRLIIFIVLVLASVGIATYAYLGWYGDDYIYDYIDATSNTTDNFRFVVPKDLSVYASQSNFGQNMGSREDSVTVSAILTPNNYTNFATGVYKIEFNITQNDIVYSEANTNEEPELILVVSNDFDGDIDIDGITPESITYNNSLGNSVTETAYDITGYTGSIIITKAQEISASNNTTTQTWTIKIVLVNYDFDQSDNANARVVGTINGTYGKTYCALVPTDEICKVGANYNNLYHHDGTIKSTVGDLLTQLAISEGYTTVYDHVGNSLIHFDWGELTDYEPLDYALIEYDQTYYWYSKLGRYYIGDYGTSRAAYNALLSDLYDAGYLEHITGDANDGAWRYSGANPNNYVCFGSSSTNCPDDNLYRIIGLIPVDVVIDDTDPNDIQTTRKYLIKLIKHNYETNNKIYYADMRHPYYYDGPEGNLPAVPPKGFLWSGSSQISSNTWGDSTLNKNALNIVAYGEFSSAWQNKIAKVMWKVGGNNDLIDLTPMSAVYTSEIVNPVSTGTTDGKTEYAAKIGLMYVSDYGYAAPPSAWSYKLYYHIPNSSDYGYDYGNVGIYANNWLYRGVEEWFITRYPSTSDQSAYKIWDENARVITSAINSEYSYAAARRVFYLTEDTVLDTSNYTGTKTDPFHVVMD